jgi:hypothetical protein
VQDDLGAGSVCRMIWVEVKCHDLHGDLTCKVNDIDQTVHTVIRDANHETILVHDS